MDSFHLSTKLTQNIKQTDITGQMQRHHVKNSVKSENGVLQSYTGLF